MKKLAERILDKHLEVMDRTIKVEIPNTSLGFIVRAMEEYTTNIIAFRKIEERKEKRRIMFMAFGYFKKLTWEEFIMALRTRSLKRHKKIAQKLANENNRKYYVVRSSDIGYVRFSSADVKMNKNLRIFGKDVTAMKLSETADAVIMPKR